MRTNLRLKRYCIASVVCLSLMLCVTYQGYALTLLEDTFNDGVYTDSWNIDWSHTGNPAGHPGDFDPPEVICAEGDCYLRGHSYYDPGFYKNAPFLYTENPTMVGTWQFKSRLLTSEHDSWNAMVLSTGHRVFIDSYYAISHHHEWGISLVKRSVNSSGATWTTLISGEDFGGQDDLWHTITATRDVHGEWSLFADEVFVGSVIDTTMTALPYLMIGRYGDYDNIRVTDDVAPPIPEPGTLFLLGSGIVGVTALGRKRRKK